MVISLEPSVLYEKGKRKMQPKLEQWLETVKDVKANQAVKEVQAREVWNTWKAYWASIKSGNAESEVIGYALSTALKRYIKANRVFFLSLLVISISIPLVIVYARRQVKRKGRLRRTTSQIQHLSSFDYIIVGAGSAGCVLANRLTQDPTVSVLLVEAGTMDSIISRFSLSIPGLNPFFSWARGLWQAQWWDKRSLLVWGYRAAENPHLNNRQIELVQGKTLGGTGAIYGMLHVRGNKNDFNSWESKYGCAGWNFENVLPFFKKSEAIHVDARELDRGYHSVSGLVGISRVNGARGPKSITKAFIKTCEFLGVGCGEGHGISKLDARTDLERFNGNGVDYNGAEQFGASIVQMRTRNGRRISAAKAYIEDLIDPFNDLHRANLTVLMGHLGSKVVSSGKTDKEGNLLADGIVLVRAQDSSSPLELFVQAKKEVIISCGAIGSPRLLLHSGIGSKQDLERIGVDVIIDSPAVGKNLQDHLMVQSFRFQDLSKTVYQKTFFQVFQGLFEFVFFRTGCFSVSGIEGTAFYNTLSTSSNYTSKSPNIQLLFIPGVIQSAALEPQDPIEQPTMQISPILLHPDSRGYVQVQSKDPYEAPSVYANHLSSAQDLQTLVSALEDSRSIFSEIRKLIPDVVGAEVHSTRIIERVQTSSEGGDSNAAAAIVTSTEYLTEFVRENVVSTGDLVGTCRMGPKERETVVSHKDLKVHGFGNLRVADASVMPEIVSGDVTATCLMIGEVCAEMVMESFQ
ncbi:UNVERIFIED_CONTAM: hypothetical protein HDU68_005881 [Siphonaria sp. JEL0065]|nr:hypothetical protein HDU68_005881 [Siphonaria sp. JEL0065]